MKYGICMLAVVAVREAPSGKSKMVNQLLFGELILINDVKNDWILMDAVDDESSGWVRKNQVNELKEPAFFNLKDSKTYYLQTLSAQIRAQNALIPVFRGAQFHGWKEGAFKVAGESYFYKKAVHEVPETAVSHQIISVANNYLNVPFLQGGKSPLGIDGAGLVQMTFKMNGIVLPRFAGQQVNKGEQILFVEASKPADLAFFENSEGNITHTGIILSKNKIIHAWGRVRIDSIDHQGIFDEELGKYTHKLRVVKRLLS